MTPLTSSRTLDISPALCPWVCIMPFTNAESGASWIGLEWEDEVLDALCLHVTSRLISG